MDLMHLFDMLLHVDKSLGALLAQYGTYVYLVLFAIVFCETGLVVLSSSPATPCCSSPAPSAPPAR